MTADVAILIVTHNSREYLADLFASLRRFTDERVPILCVDNASTDDTVVGLRQEQVVTPNLEVLEQEVNSGFAGGNNIALIRARQLGVRFVLLLNPDTVVTRAGWLDDLIAVMHARPSVGAAQPLLMLHEEPELINSAGNALHYCGFTYCGGYRKQKEDVGLNGEVKEITYATGAALLLRMSALDEVGDFDETLFLYLEELDLQLRLRQAGYECVIVPSVRVLHKYTATFSPRKYAWLERNRWMVLLKNWPLGRLVAASPALAATELAVLFVAAKNGWLREKLWAYGELVRHMPETLASRKEVMARGQAGDASHLTSRLDHEGFDHPLIRRVANPVLEAYWRLASRVLDATGA